MKSNLFDCVSYNENNATTYVPKSEILVSTEILLFTATAFDKICSVPPGAVRSDVQVDQTDKETLMISD